jgi:predicted peptidase
MHRVILSLAILVCLSFQSLSQKMPDFGKDIFIQNGDSLPYRLLKPLAVSQQNFPLVIFLHGAGERGNDNEVQIRHITELFLNDKNRMNYPCYVVAPQCPKGEMWAKYDGEIATMKLRKTPTIAMSLVIALIDSIIDKYPIDRSRIYITGLSMGGFGTWDLVSRYPDKFAAAVPICGGGDASMAGALKNLPIWVFHGSKDRIVSPKHSRKMIAALQEAGGLPGYTEYPDVEHNSWVNAYREPILLEWLFKQKKLHIDNN